eukprot:TRINITY_DN8554_c0_g2_i1.p1 TRINITY_DN8554_c0_g2~~TRINITY_DN8554_c0_g2_i1.p1  ORF type:complete len:103 (-),score=2.63 TRINITY_DN8554_c0_g2_i1:26-334(-)
MFEISDIILFLSLNFAVLFFILLLVFGGLLLVFLVLFFKSSSCGFVNFSPHFTDDLGQVGNFGIWVLGFDIIVHFCAIEEECREWFFGRSGFSFFIFFSHII